MAKQQHGNNTVITIVFYPQKPLGAGVTQQQTQKNISEIQTIINTLFGRDATTIDTGNNNNEELIVEFTYQKRWDYTEKRSFAIKLAALIESTQQYTPHFTTYEF